ncbi:MAG: hypothetical protein PHX70_07055 [Clostridium sp.]|nr:hypothetical protein [Clostridium sp.]
MNYDDFYRHDGEDPNDSNDNELYNDENLDQIEYDQIPTCCPYRCDFFDAWELSRDPAGASMPPGPPPNQIPKENQMKIMGEMKHQGNLNPNVPNQNHIRMCLFRFTYIWPRRGRGFWSWPIFLGRRSVAGYKWDGRRWVYFGMDLRRIRGFQCF